MSVSGIVRGLIPTLSSKLLQTSSIVTNSISANMSTILPKVVFVLGGPGAGKGTQCEKIAKVIFYKILVA